MLNVRVFLNPTWRQLVFHGKKQLMLDIKKILNSKKIFLKWEREVNFFTQRLKFWSNIN